MVEARQIGTEAEVSSRGGERLTALLASKVVGQPSALETILPSIHLHRSGLAPEGRPVGAFLLLGPTGTGKTRTVEAIGEVLHGDPGAVLRIDCGEFQSDHEVAKLIGAPPGYVGHFDSKPRLSVEALDAVRSGSCDLALLLFDEIEKAAPALAPLLLGILDRATLTLGSGDTVDFTRTMIFFTSNLGAREMMEEIRPGLGFDAGAVRSPAELRSRLEGIGERAVKRHFSPEFLNRIDAIVTYRPLDAGSLVAILEHHLHDLQHHVHRRLGARSFDIEVAPPARYFMLERGTSLEYGARELRRVLHRYLTQPLAAMVAKGEVGSGATVTVGLDEDGAGLDFTIEGGAIESGSDELVVLAADDSPDLLAWMQRVLEDRGCQVVTATTFADARSAAHDSPPDLAIIDDVLPDGDGIGLARALLLDRPHLKVMIMCGVDLDDEEELVCETHDFFVLHKPFLSDELIAALEAQGVSLPRAIQTGG